MRVHRSSFLLLLIVLALLSLPILSQPSDPDLTITDDDSPTPSPPLSVDQPFIPEPTPPVSTDPALPALLSYLESHKVNTSAIRFIDGPRGRGLAAARPLSINSTIFSLPSSLLITTDYIKTKSSLSDQLEELETIDQFALWLAYHRRHANSTKFAPHLQTLPPFVPLPLFYSPSISAEYKGTHLDEVATNRRATAYSVYTNLTPSLQQLASKPDYLWALSILWSRSCALALKVNGEWTHVAALAPLVDMFNTGNASEVNVKCRTTTSGKGFVCKTLREIEEGEELLVSYGPRSNGQLLHDYGFALPSNNPHDFAVIDLPSPKHNKTKGDTHKVAFRKIEVEEELLRQAGQREHDLRFKLTRPTNFTTINGVLPPDIIGWARLNCIKQYETSNLTAIEMVDRIKAGQSFSAVNTLNAVRLVLKHVRKALRRYGSTMEEDVGLLTEGKLQRENLPLYWVVLVRYSEKSVLMDVQAWIQQEMGRLEKEAEDEVEERKRWKEEKERAKKEKEEKERQKKLEKERRRREEDAREAARKTAIDDDDDHHNELRR